MALDPDAERIVVDDVPSTPRRNFLDRQSVRKGDIVLFEKRDDVVITGEFREIRGLLIETEIGYACVEGLPTYNPSPHQLRCSSN